MRTLYVLLIAMLLIGTQPATPAQAGAPNANILAATTSVTIVGDLQSELGCPGDWQPDCASTNLSFDTDDQIWQGTFTVPIGGWEYKAALNGSWVESYGLNTGPDNIPINLAAAADVKFYYSDATHWVTDNVNSVIATAVGNFQSELDCPGDWQPDCLRSWMQDPNGDGIYSFSTTDIPTGNYEGKVALDEAWTESYPGSNIAFTVNSGDTVTFTYTAATNAVSIAVTGSGASLDNNIWFDSLGHNSRDPLYRNPGGAVPTGTPITLRLRAASGDLESARVRVWNDRENTSTLYNMTKAASNIALPNDPGPYEFWEVILPASPDPTVYWYRFIVKDGTMTAYYEDDNSRTGGWGQAFTESPDNGYQLSIYDPAFTTPDWVKNAIIYQVFPDRFRDGDPSNNPAAGDFFYGNNDTIFRSNDTAWNTPICDPRENFGGSMDCADKWSNNFYGGDLKGITEKIDDGYFNQLGVTVLYLNPIFKSPSNHKYDTTDYGQIDPHFGTLEDFEDLVDAANAKNMHIILDGVFNHVSSDSPYLDRYSRYPEVGACESHTSPYRGWFYFEAVTPGTGPCVGDDGTPGGADYESWWGYDSLPKLRANSAEVRALIWDAAPGTPTEGIARYWIDQGASGWRLDVGGDVDPGTINDPANGYWEGFRDAVHDSDPQGYIVGEEWGNAISWTLGGEWDATMNYQTSAAILSFWRDTVYNDNDFNNGSSAGSLNPITAEAINERLLNLEERYPPEAFAAMMNLFGSHDTNRPLFLLNHDVDQNDTSLYLDPAYDWSDSITRLKGAALIQMTLPGAPTIYYGDEIGLVGPVSFDGSQWQDDPYNRQPYPWLDSGLGTPYYTHLQTSGGARGNLLAYYQTLTSTRNSAPALRTGSFDPLWTESGSEIYAYGRKMADDSSAAIIVVNKGNTAGPVTLKLGGYIPAGAGLSDALSSATFTVDGNGDLSLPNVPARGGYLLVVDNDFSGERPDAPLISANAVGGEQVTISWSAVTGASDYIVYRSPLSGGGYEEIGITSSFSFDDTTVEPGMRYHYVVIAVSASLLESELSNEASALPAYIIGWANLQYPPTILHTRSLATPIEDIYGQVWIDGVSGGQNAVDPTPGLVAQVGYGNDGSLPSHASWIWFDAAFNGNVGSNDEFVGQMMVEAAPGQYDYIYRYSTDGGESWVYGTTTGLIGSDLSGYNPANAGQMTVEASLDVVAPEGPTDLTVTGTTTDSVSLAWDAHPDTDGDLYGFEVWRKDLTDSETAFTRVALLAGADLIAYTDSTVTSDHEYEYYITAIDVNVNSSAPSNTVIAIAEMRMVAVTFSVTVPDPTPGTVYIAGGFANPLPVWNPGGIQMTDMGSGVWEVTLSLLDGATIEYKYARGDWEKGEKQADGNTEISNRSVTVAYGTSGTQVVENTVANWRDPIITAISPADQAIGIFPNAIITATWNQAVANPITPASCFVVSGPGGDVTGAITYSAAEMKYTFTPDSVLANGEHTVSISNCKDAGNDTQQVARIWSFTVASNPPSTFEKSGPIDNATDQPLSPTLSWNTSDGATSYQYCYSSAPGPCTQWHSVGANTSVTINDLAADYTYFWQVRAVNADGATEADGGDWWSFTTTAALACSWPAYTPPASATFGDVPMTVGHWSWVERLANATITAGCGAGNYCPFSNVVRAQMAIFLLRGKHCGSAYIPPAVGDSTGFGDVPLEASYAPWVKQLAAEGITAGCGGGNFCPQQVVNRAQMAIFLLRAKHGATYSPPAVGGNTGYGDVPLDATYAPWVKQLATEGITAGCGNGNFCPLQNVNRAQMATFLVRAFGLP